MNDLIEMVVQFRNSIWNDTIKTLEFNKIVRGYDSKIKELEQQLADLEDTEQVLTNTRNMAAKRFSEFRKEVDTLTEQLAKEREANRWIPVSERLHDNRAKQNLGRTKSGDYVICYHDELGFSVATEIGNRYIHNITHVRSINPPSEAATK